MEQTAADAGVGQVLRLEQLTEAADAGKIVQTAADPVRKGGRDIRVLRKAPILLREQLIVEKG